MSLFFSNKIAYASSQQQTTEEEKIIVLEKELKDLSKNRPNTPEINSQFVICSYSDGVITLTFTEPEGICRGSINDVTYGKFQSITFDSSELTVEIKTGNIGDFDIEFTTSYDNKYSGSSY